MSTPCYCTNIFLWNNYSIPPPSSKLFELSLTRALAHTMSLLDHKRNRTCLSSTIKRKKKVIAYEPLHWSQALRYVSYTYILAPLHNTCIQINLFVSMLLHGPSRVTTEHNVCYYTRLTCSNELIHKSTCLCPRYCMVLFVLLPNMACVTTLG